MATGFGCHFLLYAFDQAGFSQGFTIFTSPVKVNEPSAEETS